MAEEKFNWKDEANLFVDIHKYIASKQNPNLSAERIKEIENIIKYAETYLEDFNNYKATYKREIPLDDSNEEKADLLTNFFVDEANKRKDFEERLKLATQHDMTETQQAVENPAGEKKEKDIKELLEKINNNSDEIFVKNAIAYAELYNDDFNKYMQENKIEDKNIGVARFFIDERDSKKGKEFGERVNSAQTYWEIKENKDATSVKNAFAYAEFYSDDFNKYMQENKIEDKNIGVARFFIDERDSKKGKEFGERVNSAQTYWEIKENKDATSVKNAFAYAEFYSDDFNKYMQENKIEDKNIGVARFVTNEKYNREDKEFEERLELATQHDMTETQNDLTNQQAPNNVEQQPDKAEINVKNENIETDKVEQQSSEKVKEEGKNDAFFGKITRNNAGNNGNKNLESVDNLATAHSQIITLPNFPGTKKEQKLSVFDNFATGRNQNTKKLLIDIRKGYEPIAAFKIDEDTNKILLDVYDENLIKIFNKKNLNTKGLVIDSLELDKKLDIRVKALGKDIGVLFSAYGFQMKAKGPRDTIDSAVLKNEDAPYDIEIGERFLDMAIQNEFSDKENKNGCLLGNDMRLNSPTMQSLLRMASVNNLSLYDGISQKTLGDKDDKNKQIILTSTSFQFYDKNGNLQRRPMDFMEINGKPYVYLSIVEGAPNKEKREHAGRFYELSNINITNDNHVFFTIKDKSLVTIDREAPNSRTLEIPFTTDKNGYSQFIMFVEGIYKKYNLEKNGVKLNNTTNATLSNREYGTKEEWKHANQTIHNYDSAGFIRHDNAESVLGKDNIDKNKEENTLDNTVSAQGTAIIYDNPYNSYNSEESSIVSESKSSDENAEEVKEVEHEQDVPSAPPAQDIDESNENSNDDDGPEFVSYNVAPDSIPPDDKTAEKPNDEQDPQNKTPEPANEPRQAQQTQEAQPAPQPEPQPTPQAPTPPTTPPTAPPAPENEEGPKKKSALDIPFIDGGKDDKGFDKDKSNELAAKLGIGMSAMAVVLFGFSVFMPFLAIIGIGFSVGSIVAFAKPWEFFSAGASSAVDRANAKLAKEKLKELKRERKAENALANEQKQQEERTVTKNKNQKQIDSLNEENVAIDARIAMLENQKRALQTQNAILLTHGQNEGEFKNFNIDDANMNEEEKEEFNALLASINVEEAQNEEDFKIPHGERAQIHKENLYETVKDLQKAQLDYNDAQNAYKEAETQLSNETQGVEKLRENQHVAIYLGFQEEKKKLEDKLATLSSEEDKKAVNQEIKTINDKINSLTVSDAPRKAVNEYLEQTDKLKTITENYETSKQKIEELKPQIDALTTKRDTQLAVVVNDSMVEAHKDDKEIMSDQKRIATVQINTQYINALDGEIAGLQRLKEQNEKLNSTISKKMEKEDFAKQVKKRDDEYSRRVTSQQKLTESVDDYLTNISDVTKAEQEYVESQREEAKKSADLILQGYNLAAEKGLEGEELQKWLDDIDLNISNMKRTSPPEFRAGYDELRKQGEQRFAGKVPEKATVHDAKSEKASAKA